MTTISTTSRAGRHGRRPRRALAVLAAVLVTLTVTSNPALAEPTPTPDPGDYISKDVRAKMDAQLPLTSAASLIQWSVERGDAAGYAGIGIGADEVVVWWKGTLPTAVEQSIADARRSVPVRVLAAAHSRAELQAAAKGIEHYLRANPHSPYHGVDIAYDGSGLVVNADRNRTVPAGLPTEMKVPAGIRVTIAKQERIQLTTSRMEDFAPYLGGGRITNTDNGAGCTAGFAVTVNWVNYMLTAGHCGRPGGGWNNGNNTGFFGWGAYESVEHDLLLISAIVGGRIWDGGAGSGEFTKGVAGWGWVFPGEWLCTSGSVTGALCGHVVSNNFTYVICGFEAYGYYECYNDLIRAHQVDGLTAGRHGDSGGPVFGLSGSDRVIAKGTITGVVNTTDLIFQDFATAWRDFGITTVTG